MKEAIIKLVVGLSVIPAGIIGMMWGWGIEPASWGWIASSYIWTLFVGVLSSGKEEV